MENLNERVFLLFDQGLTSGKIARKLRVKKAVVDEILGNANNKGLGDTIEKFTEATGIKSVVESITNDCGCAARKETLNKLFPNRKLNDLSIEDNDWLTHYFKTPKSSVTRDDQVELVRIYNNIFNAKRTVSSCGECVAGMIRELKIIHGKANS